MPNDTATVASFDANAVVGLSVEQKEVFAGQMIQRGYDAADVRNKLGLGEKSASPSQDIAPGAKVSQVMGNSPDAAINHDQRLAGFKELYRHGSASMKATVLQQAKAAGIAPEKITGSATVAAEQPTRDQQADAANAANDPPSLAVPASPDGYHIVFDRATIDGLDPADVAAMRDTFTEAMHAAGIPTAQSQAFVTAALENGNKFDGLDDNARKLAFATEGARLRRLSSNIEETKRFAELAWQRLPKSFQDFASEHLTFHSAEAYQQLSFAGRSIAEREARRAKR